MQAKNDPGLYRRMSEPFDSADAAQSAWDAFRADIEAAREKHKITEVVVLVQFPYRASEGDEILGGSMLCIGDGMRHEVMLATGLADVQRTRQEMIGSILAKGLLKK